MLVVKDVMNKTPVTISLKGSLRDAISLMVSSRVTDLMVVDEEGHFKGVISEGDLIRYTLPNYDDIILSTVRTREQAGELFFEAGKKNVDASIIPLIIEHPIVLHPEEQLFSAATVMVSKQIHILPIVNRTRLLGTVSRGELCQAVLCRDRA